MLRCLYKFIKKKKNPRFIINESLLYIYFRIVYFDLNYALIIKIKSHNNCRFF